MSPPRLTFADDVEDKKLEAIATEQFDRITTEAQRRLDAESGVAEKVNYLYFDFFRLLNFIQCRQNKHLIINYWKYFTFNNWLLVDDSNNRRYAVVFLLRTNWCQHRLLVTLTTINLLTVGSLSKPHWARSPSMTYTVEHTYLHSFICLHIQSISPNRF